MSLSLKDVFKDYLNKTKTVLDIMHGEIEKMQRLANAIA